MTEQDREAILEAAKREAGKARIPPEVYNVKTFAGKGKRMRAPKTEQVFGK